MFYPKLQKLNLSHQGLIEVPTEVARMKQLRVLDLSYNSITSIPDFVFALPHLRTLAIGHNQLRAIPFSISSSPIRELIADYNQIDFFLPSTITGLRKLILSHNRINIGMVHVCLPEMNYLDIRHNPSIVIAGKDKLPTIRHFYSDIMSGFALMPEGMQYYL